MRYAKLGYKLAVSAFNHDKDMREGLAALTPAERAGCYLEIWIDDAKKSVVWRLGHESISSDRILKLEDAVAHEDNYATTIEWAAKNNVLFIEG